MRTKRTAVWVVYQSGMTGAGGARAICDQAEWDQMEADRPGFHTLIKAGIANEGEAERLARGTSGDPAPRGGKATPASGLIPPTAVA
jgi:hypothetical protein